MRIVIPNIFISDCSRVMVIREPQTNSLQIQFGDPIVTAITVISIGDETPTLVIETETLAKEG